MLSPTSSSDKEQIPVPHPPGLRDEFCAVALAVYSTASVTVTGVSGHGQQEAVELGTGTGLVVNLLPLPREVTTVILDFGGSGRCFYGWVDLAGRRDCCGLPSPSLLR